MAGVVFMTAEDARYGFSLAGSRQLTSKPEQAEGLLRKTVADPDIGVIVIDERLVRALPEDDFAELEANWRGLLVTLPAPVLTAEAEEDYLQRLIQRALGYHVRLQL